MILLMVFGALFIGIHIGHETATRSNHCGDSECHRTMDF